MQFQTSANSVLLPTLVALCFNRNLYKLGAVGTAAPHKIISRSTSILFSGLDFSGFGGGMNAETIAAVGGILLSLAAQYLPGFSDWYKQLNTKNKRMVMGAFLVMVAVGAFALACGDMAGTFGLRVACDKDGAAQLIQSLVYALAANQSFYYLAVRKSVENKTGVELDDTDIKIG